MSKTVWYWRGDRHTNQGNETENLKQTPWMWPRGFHEGAEVIQRRTHSPFNKGATATDYSPTFPKTCWPKISSKGITQLPVWLRWQRILLQCGRPGFSLWVGKICWRREGLPTPVFSPGEFHGLHSPWGCKELTWLSNSHVTSLH